MSQNITNADYGPLRGIERHGRGFRVRFKANGVRKIYGTYDTAEEAAVAYKKFVEKEYGEFAFHLR